MSKKNIFKVYIPYQSEFSHHCACWARNHMGWSKMKKANRKLAKTRMKRDVKSYMEDYTNE